MITSKKTHEINIRVRYGETDQMGVVYYGKYAEYLEVGRVEWLRALGVSYKWMEEHGVMLPVIRLEIDYKASARYDDVVKVRTTLAGKPSVKIAFDVEILDETNKKLVQAHTVLAFINKATGKPIMCPNYILEALKMN